MDHKKQRGKFLIALFCIFLLPFVVQAETCDPSNIKLESINLISTNGNAKETTEASVNAQKINLNLKLFEPGDSIEYNFKVKNTANEDFYFNEEALKLNTDYIEYTFIYDDNSNIVEAGKEKNIKLKVEYKNAVPTELLTSGRFNDSNTVIVSLSNKDTANIINAIENPKTKKVLIIPLLIALISSAALLVILKKKNLPKYLILIVGVAIIVPYTAFALCKSNIEIASNIQIISSPITYPAGKTKETVVVGDMVKIGNEEFYVLKHDGDNLLLLAHYNLNIGSFSYGEATGIQDPNVKGYNTTEKTQYGTLDFSYNNYWNSRVGLYYPGQYCTSVTETNCAYVYDSNSYLYNHINNYKEYLESLGAEIKEARPMTLEEAYEFSIHNSNACYETAYFLGTAYSEEKVWAVFSQYGFTSHSSFTEWMPDVGIRPMIII